MDAFLKNLIPESNRVDLSYLHRSAAKAAAMETAYGPDGSVISVFLDDDESPNWARRAARYLDDEFTYDTPGRKKLLGDVLSDLPSGDGEEMIDGMRHCIEAHQSLPPDERGHPPLAMDQDRGSCVDASCAEHESVLFGYRAAHPEILAARNEPPEAWKHSSAWYKYGDRGYCSDGWNGSGIATVARRVGCAFMVPYEIDGHSIDFSNEDQNERIVGSTWCRSGIPSWMKAHTSANHAYDDGAIVRFEGGVKELKAVVAAGGVVHTSGRRTSGSDQPFTTGSVGPHMQSGIGADDSEEIRRHFRDTAGVTIDDDDFVVWMNQTWMVRTGQWRGELNRKYWPSWYPTMYPGAWAWKASQVLRSVSVDYAWFPMAKGFPSDGPLPPPTPSAFPRHAGTLYGEQIGPRYIIEGELQLEVKPDTKPGVYTYIAIPEPARLDHFRLVPKPQL